VATVGKKVQSTTDWAATIDAMKAHVVGFGEIVVDLLLRQGSRFDSANLVTEEYLILEKIEELPW